VYPNNTQSNIDTYSTITVEYMLSNSTTPENFTRQPLTDFSSQAVDALNELQLLNASTEFFDSFYWAINLDMGQFSSDNIFTNSDLLDDATDVFHDNPFINFTFQETPLSDGEIPGDGYRYIKEAQVALVQTPAYIDARYLCWTWVGKPGLAAFIDVIVSTAVLFVLLCLPVFLLINFFPTPRRRGAGTFSEIIKLISSQTSRFHISSYEWTRWRTSKHNYCTFKFRSDCS
jgi:hypothetical protein